MKKFIKNNYFISRFLFVFFISLLILAGAGSLNYSGAQTASCPLGTTLNIVAHEDDDLLFLNPDLLHDIQSGRCVTTVFITAGDDNNGSAYWLSRENGSKAAYAEMAGAANTWTQSDAGVPDHPMPVFTLTGNTSISLIFMRLPDGNVNGSGFSNNNYESLQKVWQNTIPAMHTIDASSSYSRQNIIDVLSDLMNNYQPDRINTQNYYDAYNDGDHSDHHSAAYFAHAAEQLYATPHTFTGYYGYPISIQPVNVSGNDFTNKQNAYLAYAPFDLLTCQSLISCQQSGYAAWFSRQYTLFNLVYINVAPQATVTASSENTSTGQLAIKAVDNFTKGYPDDYTKEWATIGGGAGSWLNLSWSSAHIINQIELYDRPNQDDQILQGTLTFSDGTSVPTGILYNDGTATTITFPAKTVTSIRLDITGVSTTTQNIGLSEIQVFEQNSPTPTPTGTITPTPTTTITPTGTLTPTPTDTPTPTLSTTPTQTPTPTVTPTTTIMPTPTGTLTPTPTDTPTPTLTITPTPTVSTTPTPIPTGTTTPTPTPTPTITNIAPQATVTASSENTSTGQQAIKAIDGVADGYPGNYTKEWATIGGGAGSWLKLTWPNPQTVSQIVLYDRPNLNDQITNATIQFSDGSNLPTGILNNDGSAVIINFPAKTITDLQLNITSVSSSTANIGLAEIQIYSGTGITPTPTPTGTITPTPTPTNTPTPTPTPTGNIAPQATVTASSENTSTNQQAVKAVDGVIDGYPGDYTKEWATIGEKIGAWLNLSWPSAHTINKVVLYDRPNLNDQITQGTLTFSDGTSVLTGALNNDGTATIITFPAKTVTSVRLDITGVSASTANIGLSEIQVFE